MHKRHISSIIILPLKKLHLLGQSRTLTLETGDDNYYADIPKPTKSKSERKPYPTPMKILVQRAKQEKEARKAQPCKLLEHPPENGLLVPELVSVAHQVYRARESILFNLSKLVKAIPILRCRHCFEVHVGPIGHEIRTCTGPKSGLRNATHVWRKGKVHDIIYFPKSFHLYDRVGKPRVVHNESHSFKQIPAIVELCIQAGLNLEKYPTKRRTHPVYSIEGRIVDFEIQEETSKFEAFFGLNLDHSLATETSNDASSLATMTLDRWFEMICGVKKMMERYKVHTCGYCREVQVGPKGHKVRNCKASKHQSRNGMHAWQEATVDDLVGPNYVWHVADVSGPPLDNGLKRYYGKAPAVVEMCVQSGAPVPARYRSMMRLDVVPPCPDELDLVT